MTKYRFFASIAFSIIAASGLSMADEGTPRTIEGPILGQHSPGAIPQLFAPGIVSTDHLEIEGVFAPGMKEFYFTRQVLGDAAKVHLMRYENGVWFETVMGARPDGEVFLSTDGERMYQGNKFRTRRANGWSEQKSVGAAFEAIPVMRLTESSQGTFVFDERDETGTIRFSRLENGIRQPIEKFGPQINSGMYTVHPFIAPDESYIIWDSERENGFGDSDLYISFRYNDGSWGPAINLGETINSEFEDAYGSVTPDGKYFFFQRINLSIPEANIYWVDADFIQKLKLQNEVRATEQNSTKRTDLDQN